MKNIVPGLIGEYRYVALIRTWRLLNAQGPPVLLICVAFVVKLTKSWYDRDIWKWILSISFLSFLFFFFYGKFCLLAFIPQSRGHFMFLIITKCDFLWNVWSWYLEVMWDGLCVIHRIDKEEEKHFCGYPKCKALAQVAKCCAWWSIIN